MALSIFLFLGSALIPSWPYLIIFRHEGQVKHFFCLLSWLLELTIDDMQPVMNGSKNTISISPWNSPKILKFFSKVLTFLTFCKENFWNFLIFLKFFITKMIFWSNLNDLKKNFTEMNQFKAKADIKCPRSYANLQAYIWYYLVRLNPHYRYTKFWFSRSEADISNRLYVCNWFQIWKFEFLK